MRRDYAAHGKRGYWQDREKSLTANSSADPFDMAVVQARLGEADAMFASLGKAVQQHSTELLYSIQTEPALDRFRADPRFRDLLRQIGLPDK